MADRPRSFSLAPMDRLMWTLTVGVLLLPLFFVSQWLLRPVGVLLVVLYAGIWCVGRPGTFECSPGRLTLRFPVWQRHVHDVVRCEQVTRKELKGRYGHLLRVGAGGLWGGFGWLWSRGGWLEFYISRLDRWVLIHRASGLPVLISPADPEGLVAALTQQ